MEKAGLKVELENGGCRVLHPGQLIAEGTRRNSLYELNTSTMAHSGSRDTVLISRDLSLCHARLNHVKSEGIKGIVGNKTITGIEIYPKQIKKA